MKATPLPPSVSQYMAEIGRRGGKARVPKGVQLLTAERRQEIARNAANARWAKKTLDTTSGLKHYRVVPDVKGTPREEP